MENVTQRHVFHVGGEGEGEPPRGWKQKEGGPSNTQNTPLGHVLGVRHESQGKEDDKHIEHAHLGVFDVFVVKGVEENVDAFYMRGEVRIRPNTSNTPKMACSTCSM